MRRSPLTVVGAAALAGALAAAAVGHILDGAGMALACGVAAASVVGLLARLLAAEHEVGRAEDAMRRAARRR